MITIEEFSKINFIIGLVESVNEHGVKIVYANKTFALDINLKVQKGDKIAAIIVEDKLIIPVVSGGIPIVPDKEMQEGSKIR